MTVLNTAIAVFIGVAARDIIEQVYYEVRYRLRKRFKPNQYQYLIDRIEAAEKEAE
jgi:hypothetical protein